MYNNLKTTNFLLNISCFILTLSILLLFSSNVFALDYEEYSESPPITKQDFEKAQSDGYIGFDITYDDWLDIIKINNQLELDFILDDNFTMVYDSSSEIGSTYSLDSCSIKAGDIIITNSTLFLGLTGHASIALDSNDILHIAGIGYTPDITRKETFIEDYSAWGSWIKVYRPLNYAYGVKVASWAKNTYVDSNAKYVINTNVNSTHETYCSKIVFQAYKFGANTEDAFYCVYNTGNGSDNNGYYINFGIIQPYNLDNLIKSNLI